MLPQSLLLLSSAILASALPAPQKLGNLLSALSEMSTVASPTAVLPTSSLPAAPPSGMSLKYVTLGVGTQNYTCASTPNNATAAPASVGAVANLYDITALVDAIPDAIPAAGAIVSYLQAPTQSLSFLPQLGQHFFTGVNGTNTPTFNLFNVGMLLSAKKTTDIPAPTGAYPGAQGEGAVDWLYLTADASGLSHGLGAVYRVETAGGKSAPTCGNSSGTSQIPYAAEYWFYG